MITGNYDHNFHIIKLTAEGEELMSKSFSEGSDHHIKGLISTEQGNLLLYLIFLELIFIIFNIDFSWI